MPGVTTSSKQRTRELTFEETQEEPGHNEPSIVVDDTYETM